MKDNTLGFAPKTAGTLRKHTFLNKKLESFLLALHFLGEDSGPEKFLHADSSEILHAGSKK